MNVRQLIRTAILQLALRKVAPLFTLAHGWCLVSLIKKVKIKKSVYKTFDMYTLIVFLKAPSCSTCRFINRISPKWTFIQHGFLRKPVM